MSSGLPRPQSCDVAETDRVGLRMTRRPKQLQEEVTAALAAGTPHPQATVTDWKKRIANIQSEARKTGDLETRKALQLQLTAASDGLRAAQAAAAHKPTFLTDTNLFALKAMVLQHGGPTFSSRVPAVDAPHLKRAVQAGVIEVTGPSAKLTPTGCEIVADLLVKDIEKESGWRPRENTFVSAEKRAELLAKDAAEHAVKLAKLEATLAALRCR